MSYLHATPHQAGPSQELSEGYTDAVPVSSVEQMGNHTQSQHLGEEVCQKALPRDWTTGPQDPQIGTLSPEWKGEERKGSRESQDRYINKDFNSTVSRERECIHNRLLGKINVGDV